ncbi:hypothetical protein I7I50_09808 [Histoplasma capsulatum G186AR]|uniref:Uncharacterized protein n=1 Tax=Ajellomyces capsulatus TaxID=5037 RepID=A0A8H7Z312_AJECA|nr:hypothetical protein I7I52_10875 [Histoplasma capsulatum]QSS68741.1 hypothetical protein I7I50_09808 [Histoplasma capsulatum G186AR]
MIMIKISQEPSIVSFCPSKKKKNPNVRVALLVRDSLIFSFNSCSLSMLLFCSFCSIYTVLGQKYIIILFFAFNFFSAITPSGLCLVCATFPRIFQAVPRTELACSTGVKAGPPYHSFL